MKNTPTHEQIYAAKTWTELYHFAGLHPRNTGGQKKLKKYVQENCPDAVLVSRTKRLSDDELTQIFMSSTSARQCIEKAGWKIGGGSYIQVYRHAKRLGISLDHFTGQAHLNGKSHNFNQKPIEYYLVENCSKIQSHKLKIRLIKEGIKKHQCEVCMGTEWMGQSIPIALDHINGNHYDNRLENLRIICPNCHAQTPTFAGKKNKK